ncbi:hypothetical protein SUDANB105_05090 [Streptomyces sp. enrichment culture]
MGLRPTLDSGRSSPGEKRADGPERRGPRETPCVLAGMRAGVGGASAPQGHAGRAKRPPVGGGRWNEGERGAGERQALFGHGVGAQVEAFGSFGHHRRVSIRGPSRNPAHPPAQSIQPLPIRQGQPPHSSPITHHPPPTAHHPLPLSAKPPRRAPAALTRPASAGQLVGPRHRRSTGGHRLSGPSARFSPVLERAESRVGRRPIGEADAERSAAEWSALYSGRGSTTLTKKRAAPTATSSAGGTENATPPAQGNSRSRWCLTGVAITLGPCCTGRPAGRQIGRTRGRRL